MPAKMNNAQFQFPPRPNGERGDFDVMQSRQSIEQLDLRSSEQTAARLKLQELFSGTTEPTKIVIDTTTLADNARMHASSIKEQLTFADIEPFLTHIGNWLEFDREEVENNGRII